MSLQSFNSDGGFSTTGNISGNYFIGNGSQLTSVTANTGNVTFSDQIVIGTGISNLVSGLYLSPSSSSANAVQYLRVRGDVSYEPTHIHFDTGNNQYFNQFIGDDNKYVLLSNTGNIVIHTDNYAGNSAQWTFDAIGNLTLPSGGNINYANNTSILAGIQGTTGAQGATGAGTQGTTGAQGTDGTQGTVGAQGTQGVIGAQGTVGSQGTVGVQGVQGTDG
jgi:hypothetical protein